MTSSEVRNQIVIFGDGACSGNPGKGGWATIIATPDGEVQELGGREVSSTNNRMELMAVIRGLEASRSWDVPTLVYTDSTYVIRGITQWIWGWMKKGWVTAEGKPVANAELWKLLLSAVGKRKVEWKYVRGHSGIPGNERVDEIAVSYSQGRSFDLYSGPIAHYPVELHKLPQSLSLPEMRPKTPSQAKPFSYLSLVGTIPMRHGSWSECEGRIKGVSGAKFKKAMTAQEEMEILKSWGVQLKR